MIAKLLIAAIVMIFILSTLRRGRKRAGANQAMSLRREVLALSLYGLGVLVMVYVIRLLVRL